MIIVTLNFNPFDKCMGEWYSDIRVSRKESIFFNPMHGYELFHKGEM